MRAVPEDRGLHQVAIYESRKALHRAVFIKLAMAEYEHGENLTDEDIDRGSVAFWMSLDQRYGDNGDAYTLSLTKIHKKTGVALFQYE